MPLIFPSRTKPWLLEMLVVCHSILGLYFSRIVFTSMTCGNIFPGYVHLFGANGGEPPVFNPFSNETEFPVVSSDPSLIIYS